MILNSLFPVFAIIVLGSMLRTWGFVGRDFFLAADRLVYFIFFPSLLFLKIGTGRPSDGFDLPLFAAVLCAVLLIFALSTIYIFAARVPAFQAGSFSQSCYRFNTYIGMAVVLKAIGDEGGILFAVLIGLIIPVINLLSISMLTWFSGKEYRSGEKLAHFVRALATNPLILACFAGIAFSVSGLTLPVILENTLSLATAATLPLALISIGSAFTFTRIGGHLGLAMVASVFKLVLLPVAGFCFLVLFGATEATFQTGMVFFTLPTSPAIYVLSSQMNSDTELASASIVVSTALSFFSLSVALLMI